MDTNNLVQVSYVDNLRGSMEWDVVYFYHDPTTNHWYYDAQGGCSCDWYDIRRDTLIDFPIRNLNKVIHDTVEYPEDQDKVRADFRKYRKSLRETNK